MRFCKTMLLVLAAVLACGWAWAGESQYVIDMLVVSLRKAPSNDAAVSGRVSTGDKVEVLSKGDTDWLKVKAPSGEIGWLRGQYLQVKPPALIRLRELDPKSKNLGKRVEELAESERNLKAELARVSAEKDKVAGELTALKSDTTDLSELKDRYAALQAEHAGAAAAAKKLRQENESLRSNSSLRWFLAGAAVLLVGALLGITLSRRPKRWSGSIR